MNGSERALPFSEINPFPPSAVAQLAQVGADTVTIPTEAIQQASTELESYLVTDKGPSSGTPIERGRVLAVIGDYGTGKTHLAVHLMNSAQQWGGAAVQEIYLNAPADTFISLYRAFVVKLKERRDLVQTRVRQFYGEVVADSLQDSPFHADVVERLRNDAVDPVRVIQSLGLMESVFLEQVQERLRRVTDNKAFGTALTLLMRTGFDDAVWEWFLGNDPDEILRERGITDPTTASERSALEAMGVFALLIGHHRYRFMVVVDELDQLLSATSRPTDEVQVAFKQLLTMFVAAGAFLVLVGLPDFLNVLRADVRQRINREVTMTALTVDDAVRYIRRRQQTEAGTDTLFPFTEDTVGYLVDVAGGSPRKIISLCYHLYQRAMDQDSVVTDAMVRAVAREQLYAGSAEAMHGEIKRVLTARGLFFAENRYVDTRPVDYWIPIGDHGAAIALLVANSVLDDSQVAAIAANAAEVLGGGGDREVLLIVGAYLPTKYVGELREALGRNPLVYDLRGFADQLDAELKAMERRLDQLGGADPTATLLARVDRISQQQSNTLGLVLRLAGHIDSFAASAEQGLADVQRRLDDVWQPRAGQDPSGPDTPDAPVRLPESVAAVFADAFSMLNVTVRIEQVLRRAFDEGPESTSARRLIRSTLRQQRSQTAAGIATLLQLLTESYRKAVADWYRGAAADGDRLHAAAQQRLEAMGRTFDAILEFLPVYQMNEIADLTVPSDDQPHSTLDDTLRSNRLLQVQDVFAELSTRVRDAMIYSFSPEASS